jgi:hypothetical protein
MALLESSRAEIAEFNGLNLLMDFLNERPYNYFDSSMNYLNNTLSNDTVESEISACERVQQKAAIAISRFCKEAKFTNQLIELGGWFWTLDLACFIYCLNILFYFVLFDSSCDSHFTAMPQSE